MTAEDTRSALVRAGVELLEETGSADLGLRAIARRAGVSHGAPRRWFPTHRLLLAAVAEEGLRDLGWQLSATADGGIAAMARAYVAFARERPAMFTLIFRHDLLVGSGAELRTVSRPLFAWFTGLVGDEETAAALWVGMHGIAVLASTGSLALIADGVDEDALIERVVRSSAG
ncbi:TetR/AcrR family transcriptional regulator [Nocardia asteroides]|uniref:TetR/AcrR family transcriptional regulator n=1 Tax=Nocardia asteroides TaxID=1824 RepID=UPI001E2F6D2C|nr:TetR/AcrR family transcriptional regulator [Nocardia asteroides]UGT61224.1 TetR/AcrR family transcriptional regulator [Nocardia asteroides]